MAGAVVHFEFPSADADRAESFWSGLFGWSFGGGEPGMDYRMAKVSESQGAAIYPSEVRVGKPAFYFETDDIVDSIARVRSLGGQAEEQAPVPGQGWFAACRDSEGNPFHLWQADEGAS
jgi:predicted enzyme related to lactoylglutathione lyase